MREPRTRAMSGEITEVQVRFQRSAPSIGLHGW